MASDTFAPLPDAGGLSLVDDFALDHGLSAEQRGALRELVAGLLAHRADVDTLAPSGSPRLAAPPARYVEPQALGAGGMGEVSRVEDQQLGRPSAMKILSPLLASSPEAVARFQAEARLTARLQHPGVVPVHELGVLADGRPYFTMKQVQGRTYSELIAELHQHGAVDWEGPTLRRMVSIFHRVCETLAYAHANGVIHRDVKPQNIMVGAFGEVVVLDWGLARGAGDPDHSAVAAALQDDRSWVTTAGRVVGTPGYMSPEQARGEVEGLGPATDVYALGAMLYELLVGQPPWAGLRPREAIEAAARLELRLPAGPWPAALGEICSRALQREVGRRHEDAGELALAVEGWMDGARRRAQALALVEQARATEAEEAALQKEADQLLQESRAQLSGVQSWDPVERKLPAWAAEDRARALQRQARIREAERLQHLRAALSHSPELPEAHAALARHHQARQAEAEARQDDDAALGHELLLREHDRGEWRGWLAGEARLSLRVEGEGLRIRWSRYEEIERRLLPLPQGELDPAAESWTLPMGSLLLELSAEGCAPCRYPVHLARGEHLDLTDRPLRLLPQGALGPDDIYVPAGWAWLGALQPTPQSLPGRRRWLPGFLARRYPVTQQQYLDFINDLWARGQEEEALRLAPRQRAAREGELGALCYARSAEGRFELARDGDGDAWDPRWPAFQVSWAGAMAYAAWESARVGRAWRLPTEDEWEKSARGVDGRPYPWGWRFEDTWCCVRSSRPGRPLPAPVEEFPQDESPYGLRGMAGNVREWCLDGFSPDGRAPAEPAAERVVKGGAFFFTASGTRLPLRYALSPSLPIETVGFRLFAPLEVT